MIFDLEEVTGGYIAWVLKPGEEPFHLIHSTTKEPLVFPDQTSALEYIRAMMEGTDEEYARARNKAEIRN
jgi:hypothetical protein